MLDGEVPEQSGDAYERLLGLRVGLGGVEVALEGGCRVRAAGGEEVAAHAQKGAQVGAGAAGQQGRSQTGPGGGRVGGSSEADDATDLLG